MLKQKGGNIQSVVMHGQHRLLKVRAAGVAALAWYKAACRRPGCQVSTEAGTPQCIQKERHITHSACKNVYMECAAECNTFLGWSIAQGWAFGYLQRRAHALMALEHEQYHSESMRRGEYRRRRGHTE